MLTGDNSILKRAVDAKKATDEASAKEQIQMAVLGNYKTNGELDLEKLKTNLANIGATVIGEDFPIIAQLNGYTYEIDENSNLSYIEEFDTNIPEDAVAKMNYKYYSTLQAAIDKVKIDNKQTTILLLKDVSENVTVEANKNILLNLDSHKVTNASDAAIITLSGTLTINNGTLIGNYNSKVASICVNEGAEINLSNATVDRSSSGTNAWETIQLYGNLNIDSGKINSPNSNAICSYANHNVNINISGTAEIEGTASERPTISNQVGSKTTITGGKVSSTRSTTIINRGELEISGTAEIEKTASGSSTISNEVGSKTIISGGNITSNGNITISNSGNLEVNGTAVISRTAPNPSDNSTNGTIVTSSANVNILEGQILSDQGVALNVVGGTTTIGSSAYIASGSTDENYPTVYCKNNVILNGGTIENTAGGYAINGYSKLTNNGGTVIGLVK